MARPRPHPLSWRSRPFRAVAGLILFTLLVRLAWGWWLGHKADAELAKIRALGEPVRVEDVAWERLPDAENAAVVLKQARQARVGGVDSPRTGNLEYPRYLPFIPQWHAQAEASEAAHGPLFAIVRRARGYSRARFEGPLKSPMFANFGSSQQWNTLRDTANLVSDGAIHAHLTGDDCEAMERLLDVWHMARLQRQDDWMVSQLVAGGLESLACESAQLIAPGLRTAAPCTRPAMRDQVARLIAELLNEEPLRDGMQRSFVRERLFLIDATQALSSRNWAIRPQADETTLKVIGRMDNCLRAAASPDWPAAESMLREQAPDREGFAIDLASGCYANWFSNIIGIATPSHDAYVNRCFRVIAERRITAISLAARLYQLDHGKWPATLDDLAPAYLREVPRDPFLAGDKPMGYVMLRAGGQERPLVFYEAGPGSPDAILPTPMYGWQSRIVATRVRNTEMRQYRDLSRFGPPAATRPAE